MRRIETGAILVVGATLMSAVLAACGDDLPPPPPSKPAAPATPAPAAAAPAAAGAKGAADAGAGDAGPPLPVREYEEKDFTETDQNRDPFRSFERIFITQAKGKVVLQRTVLVDRFALDELTLVGVVTRGDPRALFTDPGKLGWVVKVGDFVGKAELVRSGGPGGADVAINWRVDRIRDSDVVFVREDPSHPEIPAATRVVALYPVDDDAKGRRR